jgi:hypothetical protein
MTTSTPATPAVTVAIPAVNKAWKEFAKANASIDGDTRTALQILARVIYVQTAPATAIQKSIEATGITASAIGYGTVKALPEWLSCDTKFGKDKAWKALTIKEQLTFATKVYSLIGKGSSVGFESYEALKVTADNAQAEKTRKAKESRGAQESTGAKVEKTTDLGKTLDAIALMIQALDPAEITDAHIEKFNDIATMFENKYIGVDA